MLIPLAAASFLVFPQSAQPRLGGTLDSQVKDFRYEDLDRELPSIPAGAEHDYLAGILANREGRLVESIRLLKKALPQIRAENPARAGSVKRVAAYVLPDAVLTVGGTQTVLHRVGVIPVPLGADMDQVYGNLGRDLISGIRSFTLDFANLQFTLEKVGKHIVATLPVW